MSLEQNIRRAITITGGSTPYMENGVNLLLERTTKDVTSGTHSETARLCAIMLCIVPRSAMRIIVYSPRTALFRLKTILHYVRMLVGDDPRLTTANFWIQFGESYAAIDVQ